MGSIKLEQRAKVGQDEKRGLEICENLDMKIAEAEAWREGCRWSWADDPGDDMKAAVDTARMEAALLNQLIESADEFAQIPDQSDEMIEDIKTDMDALAGRLADAFD